MNKAFRIISLAQSDLALRTIAPSDLEYLRVLKNSNKSSFFFKEEITAQMQEMWHAALLKRPHDSMFIAESAGKRIGCIGFRIEGNEADIYNVISDPDSRGSGLFSKAMLLLCSYITKEFGLTLSCQVIKENPAVGWYTKIGFTIKEEKAGHYSMVLDASNLTTVNFEIKN